MKSMFLLLAATGCLTAVPALAQVMTPSEYVATAGASDLYERTSSQIVLETTQDPKVTEFARMMLDAHAKSTQDVKAAAARSRVRAAPPQLTPTQMEMVAELRSEGPGTRDGAYIAQQKTAHGQALAVQQAYAREGTAPALRAAAGTIVPVVEHHIMMLKSM
jgi:putative membrane protein